MASDIVIPDVNLKLAVIDHLWTMRLLQPFDVKEYYKALTGAKYSSSADYTRTPNEEIRSLILESRLSTPLLGRITELSWEAGHAVQHAIWVWWGGDDDYFTIRSLAGLERLVNIEHLWLRAHAISDFTPIAALSRLRSVTLDGAELGDLSFLRALPYIEQVDFKDYRRNDWNQAHLDALEERGVRIGCRERERRRRQLAPQIRAVDFINRGVALYRSGRFEEALTWFDKALEINVRNAAALQYRGDALEKLERYEEALLAFNSAIDADPKSREAHYLKGRVLVALERYEEAVDCLTTAIERNEGSLEAYQELIQALVRLGRDDEAREYASRASSVDPDMINIGEYQTHTMKRGKTKE